MGKNPPPVKLSGCRSTRKELEPDHLHSAARTLLGLASVMGELPGLAGSRCPGLCGGHAAPWEPKWALSYRG